MSDVVLRDMRHKKYQKKKRGSQLEIFFLLVTHHSSRSEMFSIYMDAKREVSMELEKCRLPKRV